tara:strand:+ start:363 stop:512 length:150 start_codon:yes stop_codon:yes gene_type:complete
MGNSKNLSELKVVGGDGVKRGGLRVKEEKVGESIKRVKVEESIKWVVNY